MRTCRMRIVAMKTHDLEGLILEAQSTGGIESSYRLPKLRILFDIGRCPPGSDRYPVLFLSHSHIDHSAGLPYYVSLRSLKKMAPPTVYCPMECRDDLQKMLNSWVPLDADADHCRLIGLKEGDEIPLKDDSFVRAFSSPHRVPVRGYTIHKKKRRLKAALQGMDASEVATRARAGEQVNEVVVHPEFCFPGDTLIESIEREESITRARVLLLECTFAGNNISVDRARKAGHIHLDQIAERAELFKNEIILLTHWSQRYSDKQIQNEVSKALPESLLKRVKIIFPERSE